MSKKKEEIISGLLSFLDASPTPWHAVNNCIAQLEQQGFQQLKEEERWQVKAGGRYFVTRNGSSLCAFILPSSLPTHLHLVAAHTDSPAFKLKPHAEFIKENMVMLGLEVYGAPLIASWLNRDLGIAGRVISRDKKGVLKETLVAEERSPIVIPQLALHLDRTVNESGPSLNKQEHLAALAGLVDPKEKKPSYLHRLLSKVLPPSHTLLSFDLFAYPLEKARLVGETHACIAAYRLDNLASVHASLQGMLNALTPHPEKVKAIIFWDHEEIGSHTAQGAGSPFFLNIMERISLALKMPREDFLRLFRRSLCVSVDLAHAQHPNYKDKHEPHHQTLLNQGIVIKTNAQQRYATDAVSASAMIALCQTHDIPYQDYLSRGDLSCGSTVGPIHASLTGMPTVDIGYTELSMHSCRELCGAKDHESLCKLLTHFLNE